MGPLSPFSWALLSAVVGGGRCTLAGLVGSATRSSASADLPEGVVRFSGALLVGVVLLFWVFLIGFGGAGTEGR